MNTPPTLMTVRDVAQRVAVTDHTVRRWIREGRLGATRLPSGRIRISPADLERFMTGEDDAA